jgi:cellulose synthase/poly-beta-1,6-N-acetylglucosamine synthase-like glycosyltransferase
LLPRAVESAQRAGQDVEVIVVDDASEDETANVCRTLAGITYIRLDRNQGVAGARNIGLLECTGDYIAFLDDDDVRLPSSIDAQVKSLKVHPEAGMIYGRVLYGDQECRAKGGFYPDMCHQGDLFWRLMRWNFIPCPSVVFRRACLLRVGFLDESAPGIDDWDLWVRVAELYQVLATEQPVAIWRQPTPTSGQFSFRADGMHRQARRLHRDKWLRLPRAVEAGAARRREAAGAFADCASQQLVWEAAARLKAKRLPDFVRVGLAGASMYPIGVSRIILSSSTRRSLVSGVANWRRG